MTRIPELERALIAAGHRRYTRPSWQRAIRPVAALAAVAACAAVLVSAASLGRTDRERSAVSAVDSPKPSSGELVLPEGEPLSGAQVRQVERYGKSVSADAFAVPAPPMSADSLGNDADEWLVIPEGDKICVWRGSSSICGARSSVAERGAIASILPGPDAPIEPGPDNTITLEPGEAVGSGPATMWGLVPPDFVQVRAPGAGITVDVSGQLFDLTVPNADGLKDVVLLRNDESSLAVGGGPSPESPVAASG